MSSKRNTSIFAAALARAAEGKTEEVPRDLAPEPLSGNWSRMALQGFERSLIEQRELLAELIVSGSIPVRIDETQIVDEVGTDRIISVDEGHDSESMEALTENIRRRGLRTPLRVRPSDPAWRPDPKNPLAVGSQVFVLQSGRRRLAACRALGVTPTAFLSFVPDGSGRIEDLQERFFENVARRNLTTVEKLFSVGLMMTEMPGMTQSQAAEMLHTSQPMISRAVNLFRNFDAINAAIDLRTAGFREIDEALQALKPGKTDVRRDRKTDMGAAGTGTPPAADSSDLPLSLADAPRQAQVGPAPAVAAKPAPAPIVPAPRPSGDRVTQTAHGSRMILVSEGQGDRVLRIELGTLPDERVDALWRLIQDNLDRA